MSSYNFCIVKPHLHVTKRAKINMSFFFHNNLILFHKDTEYNAQNQCPNYRPHCASLSPIAIIGLTWEYTRPVFLNVPRSLYIFAIIPPGLGRAESFGAQFAFEHTSHLDAVGRLENVTAVRQVGLVHLGSKEIDRVYIYVCIWLSGSQA